jgi:hypothetical protein
MTLSRSVIVALTMTALPGCVLLDEQQDAPVPKPEVVAKPEIAPPPPAPPAPAPPSPQIQRMNEIDGLLSEFERLRRLTPAELAREQESARQAFNQLRSDASRLRLAMALGVPGNAGTEERALEVLDPLVKNPAMSLHGLAFLLAAYIQEQRRLTSHMQGLQQNVQGLQQNVQGLQQKLDALRTLERSLTERDSATPRRR